MAQRKCRLWWPEQLLSRDPGSGLLLFGWFLDSGNSLDVVVATARSPCEILPHLCQLDLKEMLHSTNEKMPMLLQDSTTFSLLGICATDCNNHDLKTGNHGNDPSSGSINKQLHCPGVETNPAEVTSCNTRNQQCNQESYAEATFSGNCVVWNCGCEKVAKFIEPHRLSLIKYSNWIQLFCKSQRILCKENSWVPELHHMHLNGHILPTCDVHLIIYELPTYGRHHFALSSCSSSKQVIIPFKKPDWVGKLHKKPTLPDLDMVILALNCASAAMIYFGRSSSSKSPVNYFSWKSMLASIVWHTGAVFVASTSTVIYIIIQFFHSFLRYGSPTFIMMLPKVFRRTWQNVHIRSCQFMYWPIFLQGCGYSSQINVEYAHRAALRRHLIWSSVAMDILLGIVFGFALLANLDAVCFWVLFLVRYITDNLVRSGCVWLMGIPAGFKLNTELAELLGMISLNTIQVFSTLWFFMASLLRYFIGGFAVAGIMLGLTVPAALFLDMLELSTLHIMTLHWLISLLYSRQIQALASLWRLFRGRKWNPLRQRLDSYDYIVEQHVVGSLLFTPLLLLLPTTSVFYIFFTILNTSISFTCISIETIISILHATPYAEIFLWITKRRRFPSGIWLEIISCPAVSSSVSRESPYEDYSSSNLDQRKTDCFVKGRQGTVVSLLRCNCATIGKIMAPYYNNVLHGVFSSYNTSWAYGVFSGQRIPSTLQSSLPSTMPWMHIKFGEYWRLCHNSVLACRS